MKKDTDMIRVTLMLIAFCVIISATVLIVLRAFSWLIAAVKFAASNLFTAPVLFWVLFLAVGAYWMAVAVMFWRQIKRGEVDGPALCITREDWRNMRREVGKHFSFAELNLHKKMEKMRLDVTLGGDFPDDVI